MKFQVHLTGSAGKKLRTVETDRGEDGWKFLLDGQPVEADVVEIAPYTLSLLLDGQAFEIRVTPMPGSSLKLQSGRHEFTAEVVDPRAWRGRKHGALEAEGRQQVFAPMPGKVIRILVQEGEIVETGQGLLVVEAMKMQNEIRSPKGGTVERLHVKEGQPVNAGEVLCIVS